MFNQNIFILTIILTCIFFFLGLLVYVSHKRKEKELKTAQKINGVVSKCKSVSDLYDCPTIMYETTYKYTWNGKEYEGGPEYPTSTKSIPGTPVELFVNNKGQAVFESDVEHLPILKNLFIIFSAFVLIVGTLLSFVVK